MLGPRLGRQSATGRHLCCNVGEEQPGEGGTGREWWVGRVGSCTSGPCAKKKRKKTPNPTITTDSPLSHYMLERSTSLQARHCAHKCTVVRNNSTVVQGRTSELTAGLGGLALGSGSSADVWPAKWWPGVWQLVATARRWSLLYIRGAQKCARILTCK